MSWCSDQIVLGVGVGLAAAASALVVVDEPLARLITLGSAVAALIVVACLARSTLLPGTRAFQNGLYSTPQCELGLAQCTT